MSDLPLIEAEDVETRLGRTLSDTETVQVTALIDDASALVRDIAEVSFINDMDELDVPSTLVPVLVGMVRRGMENPLGWSSKHTGDVGWSGTGSIYATKRETAIIRRAAGTLGVAAATLEGDLPWRPSEDEFLLGDFLTGQ